MKTILSIVVAIALALSFMLVQPIQHSYAQDSEQFDPQQFVAQNPDKYTLNENGFPIVKGAYNVILKNETFAPINNDPRFDDPIKYTPSNIPEKNAQVVPELLHEYQVKTGAIVHGKIEEYNGTATSHLAPLPMQGGFVDKPYIHAIKGFTIQETEDISVFVGDPDIAVVEPVVVEVPHTQYIPTSVQRTEMTKSLSIRANGVEDFPDVDIALLDTGVLPSHPDINVFRVVDVASGVTSVGFHGTHTAGTAAARDNAAGVVGTAPGARVWALNTCSATDCSIGSLAAMDYVISNAASIEVVNISFGHTCGWLCPNPNPTSSAMGTAFTNAKNAGVTIVVSAGNDRIDAANKGHCHHVAVICVSNLADFDGLCGGKVPSTSRTISGVTYTVRDDARSVTSNFGSVVDLMAPGTTILSTFPIRGSPQSAASAVDNTRLPFIGDSVHGGYGLLSGTSMAAPFVSGAAAMVKAKNPSFTPDQVLADLQAKAINQNTACDNASRGGLVVGANSDSSEKIINLRDY